MSSPIIYALSNHILKSDIFQDVLDFMVIFFVVIVAVILGFLNLYWYYEPGNRKQVEVNTTSTAEMDR